MKNIRNIIKVGTEVEYRSMMMAGMLPMPHTVKIADTGEIIISGDKITKETAMPGDYVCFDTNDNMHFVGKTDEVPEGYSVEAIVVAPEANTPVEGKVLCMSTSNLKITGQDDTVKDEFTAFIGFNNGKYFGIVTHDDELLYSCAEQAYLPSEMFGDKGYTGYSSEASEMNLAPGPYTTSLEYNEKYGESYDNNGIEDNALVAEDSLEVNNLSVQNASEDSALLCAMLYGTEHLPRRKWFVPSMFDLGHLVNRYNTIKASLDKVNGEGATYPQKLLSCNGYINQRTEEVMAWTIDLSNGKAEKEPVTGNGSGQYESGSYKTYAFIYV